MSATIERFGRALLLSMPTLLALVFYPSLEAPFTDAKTALFFAIVPVIVCTSIVLRGLPDPPRSGLRPMHIAAQLLVWLTLASLIVSQWRYLGENAWLWPVSGLLLFGATRWLLHNQAKHLLSSIATAGSISALISALQHATKLDLFRLFGSVSAAPGRMALYGTLGNPDWLGAFLAMTLPATLASAVVAQQRRWRVVWSLASLLELAMTILTGSRAAILASALGILTVMLLRSSRLVRLLAPALTVLLVAVAIVTPHNRRTAITALHGRTVIWRTALSAPAPSPLLGSGPNSFSYLYPLRMGTYFGAHPQDLDFASYERHAQNDFVETYAETGLLGLGALLAMGISGAALIWQVRLRSPEYSVYAEASLAALVSLAVLACFDFPLHRSETWTLAWLWLALPFLHFPVEHGHSRKHRVLVVVLCAVFLVWSVQGAVRPLLASHRVASAQQRESLGDLSGAETDLRAAIRLNVMNATAQFDLVRILAKQERYAEALEQSVRAEPWMSEPELFLLRSRILRAMDREDEARRTALENAARFPYSQLLADELASFPQDDAGRVAPR